MLTRRWVRGCAPVSVDVACDGEVHRVTWRAGKLVVENHDVRAELALAALGGDPPSCVRVLQAWRRVLREPDLGSLWDLESVLDAPRTWRVSPARTVSVGDVVGELPIPLQRVAALAAIVRAHRRWDDATLPAATRHRLEHFLASRVRDAIQESLEPMHIYRPHFELHVRCAVAGPADEQAVEFHTSQRLGHLHCRLPLWWLVVVWARGLAAIDGATVLDAARARGSAGLTIGALRWELDGWYRLRPEFFSAFARHEPNGAWRIEEETSCAPELVASARRDP
jgi:hypothetical protein